MRAQKRRRSLQNKINKWCFVSTSKFMKIYERVKGEILHRENVFLFVGMKYFDRDIDSVSEVQYGKKTLPRVKHEGIQCDEGWCKKKLYTLRNKTRWRMCEYNRASQSACLFCSGSLFMTK